MSSCAGPVGAIVPTSDRSKSICTLPLCPTASREEDPPLAMLGGGVPVFASQAREHLESAPARQVLAGLVRRGSGPSPPPLEAPAHAPLHVYEGLTGVAAAADHVADEDRVVVHLEERA